VVAENVPEKPQEKTGKEKKPKIKKEPKPKKEKPAKVDLRVRVPHFPKSYELIRRFVNLDGKPRSFEQIQRFHLPAIDAGMARVCGHSQPQGLQGLAGALGRFLSHIKQLQYALVLRGKKGAGKTRLLYQLMDLFAGVGFTVANFTLEIRKDSDIVARMTEEYIRPENRAFIQTADSAPEGVTTIRQAAAHFDVVAIDSWSKLGARQEEFDWLRQQEFPDTFFLIIY
jgi:hypothetical protein